MPNQERTFIADGRTYAIRFTQNALYKLEEKLGRRIDAANFGVVDFQTMLWAGLEGARLKHKSRTQPFTIEETGDIVDAMREGGLDPMAIIMDAWTAAMAPPAPAADAENGAPENPTQG
jgi:hypothetical protein